MSELPLPLILEGENGNCEVYELKPAGKGKLGASMIKAAEYVRRMVLGRRPR